MKSAQTADVRSMMKQQLLCCMMLMTAVVLAPAYVFAGGGSEDLVVQGPTKTSINTKHPWRNNRLI